MKKKFIKVSSYVLTLALSALGLTSCDKINPPCMYGSPSADFAISGKVTDRENKPIQNIEISTKYITTQTDVNGDYLLNIDRGFPNDFEVTFTDIDGSENGSFETKETLEIFEESDYVGRDGSWYKGKVTRTTNVTLTEEKVIEE